jgi:hypothetical protein
LHWPTSMRRGMPPMSPICCQRSGTCRRRASAPRSPWHLLDKAGEVVAAGLAPSQPPTRKKWRMALDFTARSPCRPHRAPRCGQNRPAPGRCRRHR